MGIRFVGLEPGFVVPGVGIRLLELGFWPPRLRTESNFGGGEKLRAGSRKHDFRGHGVNDAGDEVANILIVVESRQGLAEGGAGSKAGDDLAVCLSQLRLIDLFPNELAVDDGGDSQGRTAIEFFGLRGEGLECMEHGGWSFQGSGIRDQGSEIRDQRTGIRDQGSENRDQRSENRLEQFWHSKEIVRCEVEIMRKRAASGYEPRTAGFTGYQGAWRWFCRVQ